MTCPQQPSGERSRGPKASLKRPAAALPGSDGEEAPRECFRRGQSQQSHGTASGGRKRSSAAAAAADDPPYYQGGQIDIGNQNSVVSEDQIGLHWATITGPHHEAREVREMLTATFGNTMQAGSGGAHYTGSWRWPVGVTLSIDHSINRSFRVMVTGGACDLMGGPNLWAFLRRLFIGDRKCTRFDIYRDQRGENIRLIDDALDSCRARELCHARRFKPHDGRLADTKTRLEHGLELGSRASNRYIRIYDKGLETGNADHRQWVRFEVEFKQEPAHEAAQRVLSPGSYELAMVEAANLLIGSVDFRIPDKSPHIERRKRPEWWTCYCGDRESVRPRVKREDSDWRSKVAWLREQVGPTLCAWAQAADCTPGQMFEAVVAGVKPKPGAQNDPITADIAQQYSSLVTPAFAVNGT